MPVPRIFILSKIHTDLLRDSYRLKLPITTTLSILNKELILNAYCGQCDTIHAKKERLKGFLDDILVTLGRSERRRWGDVYVRGLLAASGRKATASMATRVSQCTGNATVHWTMPLAVGTSAKEVGASFSGSAAARGRVDSR
jgi:hypothetical protein